MANRFPIFKGAIYNTTKGTDQEFFSSDLLPVDTPTTFLIYYYPGSGGSSLPRLKRKNGTNTIIETFNAQSTTAPYMFQTLVAPGDSINLTTQEGGPCSIGTLIVIEIETTVGNSVFHIPRMG
jgi:hypothetical protein